MAVLFLPLPMHTLIQSQATKSYFDFAAKRWIDKRTGGTIFHSETEAIRACMREGLAQVQLVLLGDGDPTEEVVVPLDRDVRRRRARQIFE